MSQEKAAVFLSKYSEVIQELVILLHFLPLIVPTQGLFEINDQHGINTRCVNNVQYLCQAVLEIFIIRSDESSVMINSFASISIKIRS